MRPPPIPAQTLKTGSQTEPHADPGKRRHRHLVRVDLGMHRDSTVAANRVSRGAVNATLQTRSRMTRDAANHGVLPGLCVHRTVAHLDLQAVQSGRLPFFEIARDTENVIVVRSRTDETVLQRARQPFASAGLKTAERAAFTVKRRRPPPVAGPGYAVRFRRRRSRPCLTRTRTSPRPGCFRPGRQGRGRARRWRG